MQNLFQYEENCPVSLWKVITTSPRIQFFFCRYWHFEPRCYMHDTGGWYIETYGRDKKGKTIPSQRHWDGFNEHSERWGSQVFYCLKLACLVDIFACSAAVHKVRNVNHQLGFSIWNCRRLHPAMYLVALAYRSLDLEDARRRQWNMSNFLQLPLSHILQLFKRIVNGHGEKKGVDWGHHENFCLGIIFLLYQLCLKLGVSVTPCFCFILSLKQLFVNVAM